MIKLIVASVILLGQIKATEPEIVNEAIPWDGVTMRVEDVIRNPRGKEELCELLRENFYLSVETRNKVAKDLNALTKKDWENLDSRYAYITLSFKSGIGGYGQFIQIHFHNERIHGESIERQNDE